LEWQAVCLEFGYARDVPNSEILFGHVKTDHLAPHESAAHNTLAAMADHTVRVLRCLVKGGTIPMKLSISVDKDVDDLKEMIHERGKNGVLQDTDIQDLFVYRVRTTLTLE
jgi:hypothetical protein